MKRFQTASECLRATDPIVFHSFCKAIIFSVVLFQSVLSFNASAFHTRLFQCEILFHLVLYILVEFAFAVEINVAGCAETFEYLHVRFLRGEADRFPFVLQGNYFLIFSSQSLNDFKAGKSMFSICSQMAVLASRFSCSFAFNPSKCS